MSFWCSKCRVPMPRRGYCNPCKNAYERQRLKERRGYKARAAARRPVAVKVRAPRVDHGAQVVSTWQVVGGLVVQVAT